MTKEIEWQAKLVKRFKAERAYARKASSTYAVGVLDLDVVIPDFGGLKIEVKLETGLKPGWRRTPEYTERQKEEAEDIQNAGGRAIGLVICHYNPSNIWLLIHPMPKMREKHLCMEADLNVFGLKWGKSAPGDYLSDYVRKFYGR